MARKSTSVDQGVTGRVSQFSKSSHGTTVAPSSCRSSSYRANWVRWVIAVRTSMETVGCS